MHGVVERPHAHPVARNDEALVGAVPDGVGEVAVERLHALRPELGVGVQNRLGIALRAKLAAARDQLLAQLDVIEYFPIERDPQPSIGGGKWLAAAGEVDDREAPVAERGAVVVIDATIVRPAMAHRLDHAREHLARRERASCECKIAGDAAHPGSEAKGWAATFVTSACSPFGGPPCP